MRAARPLAVAGSAMAFAAASFGQAGTADAAAFLTRSMQREFPVNVVSILLQRSPGKGDAFIRVKVERRRDGLERQTILQPLRLQGITMVDDGERAQTYVPDEKIIIEQESPSKAECLADQRMRLARKNYSFRFAQSGKIAGRDTVCVVATPRYGQLELRKYYLDQATAYPLRQETFGSGNEINVIFDTKDIQFPKTLDKQLFSLSPVGNVRRVRYNRPKRIVSGSAARSIVGFTPLIPDGLPMGFEVQEVQYSESEQMKSIVVRLSDGLARATVYQTASGSKMNSLEDSTTMEYGGVRLMLVSDLSAKVREQLLKSFIAEAASSPSAANHCNLLVRQDLGIQAAVELMLASSTFAKVDGLAAAGRF